MSLVKPFKLVPLNMFEKMIAGQECKNDQSDINSDRSIKNIVESDIEKDKSHFNGSKHFVAEFKIPEQQPEVNLKGGGNDSTNPIFLPETDTLPEFSKGALIKKSFDNVNNILNDPSLPESLKLKMYLILRSKYDRTRNKQEVGDNESDSADESNHSRPGNMSALTQAVSDLPKNKIKYGRRLAEILSASNFIDWDQFGNIISPKIQGARKFDLSKLFRLILYKDEGKREELTLLSVIIKPIINKLMKEQVVLNEKLLKTSYFSGYHIRDNLSKYMSW